MRLLAEGNAKHWNPADIDFTQDAKDFAAMTDDERRLTSDAGGAVPRRGGVGDPGPSAVHRRDGRRGLATIAATTRAGISRLSAAYQGKPQGWRQGPQPGPPCRRARREPRVVLSPGDKVPPEVGRPATSLS